MERGGEDLLSDPFGGIASWAEAENELRDQVVNPNVDELLEHYVRIAGVKMDEEAITNLLRTMGVEADFSKNQLLDLVDLAATFDEESLGVAQELCQLELAYRQDARERGDFVVGPLGTCDPLTFDRLEADTSIGTRSTGYRGWGLSLPILSSKSPALADGMARLVELRKERIQSLYFRAEGLR
ncbi:MAG: hypothetical protein WD226_06970 [Planctomycetota bacterium]